MPVSGATIDVRDQLPRSWRLGLGLTSDVWSSMQHCCRSVLDKRTSGFSGRDLVRRHLVDVLGGDGGDARGMSNGKADVFQAKKSWNESDLLMLACGRRPGGMKPVRGR